ncbi:S-layer homology domain-containing protein [Egbenema bharatensis]|uniref:S-layer homology domain-containing protein n=1 Tax=Egbenema bharatensis TaxID=3463334 RepID=UPI003A83B48E
MLVPRKKISLLTGVAVSFALTSCANGAWTTNLERSLEADPALNNNPTLLGGREPGDGETTDTEATPTPADRPSPDSVQLPGSFPGEIPAYPNAALIASFPQPGGSEPGHSASIGQTRWRTTDDRGQVEQFYQSQFQEEGWQLVESSNESANSASVVSATRDNLRVTVAIAPSRASENNLEATEFTINYQFTDRPATSDAATNPATPAPESAAPNLADLEQAPAELQPYITDLRQLGALSVEGNEFNPNQEITRREYARWLVESNNLIYANQPSRKIRLGSSTDQPAFQDVSTDDPDFGAIQGLANAGLIPSSLSGNTTAVTFRPDAPLTREDMVLWKAPIDSRQALPNASIDAVQQTWGFQDAPRISPEALRAVLADYQNGDLSNIRRAFGYTTLFQPQRSVSRAEAAAALWFFGSQGNGLSAQDALSSNRQASSD